MHAVIKLQRTSGRLLIGRHAWAGWYLARLAQPLSEPLVEGALGPSAGSNRGFGVVSTVQRTGSGPVSTRKGGACPVID